MAGYAATDIDLGVAIKQLDVVGGKIIPKHTSPVIFDHVMVGQEICLTIVRPKSPGGWC